MINEIQTKSGEAVLRSDYFKASGLHATLPKRNSPNQILWTLNSTRPSGDERSVETSSASYLSAFGHEIYNRRRTYKVR